jgi:hypothetical protein
MTASGLSDETIAEFIEDALDGIHIGPKARGFYDFASRLALLAYAKGVRTERASCVDWVVKSHGGGTEAACRLQAAREFKLPSPRQRALAQLALVSAEAGKGHRIESKPFDDLKALLCELLPDD